MICREQLYEPVDKYDRESARPDFAMLIYPAYLVRGEGGSLTPELNLEGDIPPMFFFATADDSYTKSSLVMGKALYDRGLKCEFHIYPEGGHGFGMRKGNPAAETWPALAKKYLDAVIFEKRDK